MAYKMTVSLLSAYQWYKDCPSSWKDKALAGLKGTLTEGFTGSVATARGDKFEAKINSQLNKGQAFSGMLSPLNFLFNMKQQMWLKPLEMTVDNMDFVFRGRMDYVGQGWRVNKRSKFDLAQYSDHLCICDLKTTGSTIKEEKYSKSVQHLVYMLAMDVPHFFYFVCEFPTEAGLEPSDLQVFHYTRSAGDADELVDKIEGLVKTLKDYNLWKDYTDIFCGGKK